MKFLLVLTALCLPTWAQAINPSYLIHNRDIPVTEFGINAFRDPAKVYNVQKGTYTPQGQNDRVWSQGKNGGYFLSVDYSKSALLGVSEIYRKGEGSHTARKITMNANGSIKSMTDCDASKGAMLNSMHCMTATPALCDKVSKVFSENEDLERNLMACDKASSSMKKIKDLYDREKNTASYKNDSKADTDALKKDFGTIVNTLSWTDWVSAKEVTFSANEDLITLGLLCAGKIKAENGVWRSAAGGPTSGAPGNTSSQRGQQ